MALHGRPLLHLHEPQLGAHEDGRQHVVEIVRHAAGKAPHRLHLLRLNQLFLQAGAFSFGLLALCHVSYETSEPAGSGAKGRNSVVSSEFLRIILKFGRLTGERDMAVAFEPYGLGVGHHLAYRLANDLCGCQPCHALEGRIDG